MPLAIELQQVGLTVLHNDVHHLLVLVVERFIHSYQVRVVKSLHNVHFFLNAFALERVTTRNLLDGHDLILGGESLQHSAETTLADLLQELIALHNEDQIRRQSGLL